MVEPQPSKLIMRVRFPSPAPQDEHRSDTFGIKPFFMALFSHLYILALY